LSSVILPQKILQIIMSLKSDVNVDPAKFDRKNIDQETLDFNQKLIKIWADGPRWYEVRSPHLTHPFEKFPFTNFPPLYTHTPPQVGAAKYRQLRWDGKTPLPKPIVLEHGVNGSLPSRDAGRTIPYRMFKPEGEGESKGLLMHIHGGGWVLQSEA
jgi:acetyl esterase/lipase